MARLRRLARLAGTLLVVLWLAVASVAVVVQTDWFKNWLRLRLVSGLAGALDGELRIGRLSGSLWTGVTFDNLELLNRHGQVLTADHVRVRYDPFTLARRRWIVDRVVIERASVRLVETPTGWNVQHLWRPRPGGGAPPTVVIHDVEVAESTVTIDTVSAEPRTLTNVDLKSALTVSAGVVSMTVDSLRAFDSVTGLALRDFSGAASDNFRTFDVAFAADSSAEAGQMRVDGKARGEMTGETRVLTADIDASHLDLARLLSRPQFESDITGRGTATVTLPPSGGDARVTFEFSGARSRALGYTAERIRATGEIADGAVTFDSRVAAYGAQASAHGVWRWADDARPMTFTGRGTFAGVNVRRLPPTLRLPLLDSNVAGKFDTAVNGRGWRAHAAFSGGVVEGARIAAGTEASIQAYGGVTRYTAEGEVTHVDLQRIGRAVPIPALTASRFSSDLSGKFAVTGLNAPAAPPHVVGTAELADSTISGTRLESLTATASLMKRRLLVSANGRFENLTESILGLPAVPLVAGGDLDGWFAIADLDQPITEDNLQLSARVNLGPSVIRDVKIDSAVVDGRLLDGALTLPSLEIRTADGVVQASGALGIHEPISSAGITVTAAIHNRGFLERILQQPIQTAGSVDAIITGTTASPSATGTVTLHQTAYRDVATALTATTTFEVDWPERDIDRLAWTIESDATFVTLGNTEIQRLLATSVGGPRDMAIEVTAEQKARSLGIEGQLTLLPDSRELLLRQLALTTQNIEWSLPAGQSAVIRYGGDRVDVSDLTLVRDAQQIAIAGGFNLETNSHPGGAGRPLELTLRDVELADVNHALLGTRQLTGRINGAVTVSGHRAAPVVDGEVTIAGGVVEGVSYQSVQARGQYTEGTATVDAVLDQAPGAVLHVVGTVPVAAAAGARRAMDLRVTGGPINLGLIQAFTTELGNVAGDAALDLRVTGSISDPMVAGVATLANGAFDVMATGVRYQQIEATLDFAEGQMAVRHLRLADDNGDELTATGGLDIRRGVSNRAVDISVRSRSFSVLDNQFGTAAMDMDIRVSGELAAPVVTGTATLEEGRVEVADLLEQTTARPYATTPQDAPGAGRPAGDAGARTPWERADVALKIGLPDNLVLRGRNLRVSGSGFGIGDMNIIMGGSFDVTKRPGAAVDVQGHLDVVQGSYSFQGRRFDIERGSEVRFPGGGSLTDPIVHVNATREISGITAEVRLRGRARSPELTLSSRPLLDESDILSLIVFNQPVSSLGSAQQENLGARAAAMAAGAIASPLADSIGRALNLDVFEIQAPTDSGTGSVLVGSQLGSRVLVGLRQEFGHSEASLVTLEYRVNEWLRLVTSVATGTLQAHATRRNDRGGVDLIFVFRY